MAYWTHPHTLTQALSTSVAFGTHGSRKIFETSETSKVFLKTLSKLDILSEIKKKFPKKFPSWFEFPREQLFLVDCKQSERMLLVFFRIIGNRRNSSSKLWFPMANPDRPSFPMKDPGKS
jgi:hypothetical protein